MNKQLGLQTAPELRKILLDVQFSGTGRGWFASHFNAFI